MILTRLSNIILSILIISCIVSCEEKDVVEPQRGKIIAEVGTDKLYEKDIERISTSLKGRSDSLQAIRTQIENWVRDRVFYQVAERNTLDAVNIDRLVDDYRKSLIVHQYENLLIQSRMDTNVTEDEMYSYYEGKQEQFRLSKTMISCQFLKIDKPVERLRDVRKWWRTNDNSTLDSLVNYSSLYSGFFVLERDEWLELEDLISQLPPNLLTENNAREGKEIVVHDSKYRYFLRLLEIRKPGDITPYPLIKEEIQRLLLFDRRNKLLADTKENIFNKAVNNNQIKIY